jgi:hypothetical protein
MARVNVDESTLESSARIDVAYELEQYVLWSLTRPPRHANPDIDLRLRQACFEVAVLHLRNLVDFLTKERPVPGPFSTDLVADHYFDDGWASKPDRLWLYSDESDDENARVRRNVNRHLAHITTSRHELRVSGQPFEWDEINPALVLEAFLRFVDDLDATHPSRAGWFALSQRNAVNALAQIETHRMSGSTASIMSSTSPTFVVTSGALDPDGISRWMT